MFDRWNLQPRRRPARTIVVAAALTGALALSACGDAAEPVARAAETTAVAATAPTTAPPTTTAPTSTAALTTTTLAPAVTTTAAPTTTEPLTTIALEHTDPVDIETQPVAPPADAHASEPVIEMGTISIPKLGVEMTMYEGIRLTTLDQGPGHWPGTALPGQAGNVVVGGHRTSKHRVFRDVDQLVPGDEIVFHDAGGEHVYRVDRVEVVDPTAIWIVDPTDTPTATLFACHPPGSTSQRIVVFADLAT